MQFLPRMLASLAFIVLSVLVLLSALLYFMQSAFVYFPMRVLQASPADVGLPFEEVMLETADGVRIHGWMIPHPAERATVLFLHGNGGNISHRLEKILMLRELGMSVLIIDYRGYGRSQGAVTEEGTYRDARAAWDYLAARPGKEGSRILLYGESLGAAVAAWLATQVESGGLILESAFTSIEAMGRRHYPYLPVRWLVRIHYPTLERMPAVTAPVLIIHSPQDEIVPFEMGQALFAAAPPRRKFVEIRGGHNDGFLVSADRFKAGIDEFVSQYVYPPAH